MFSMYTLESDKRLKYLCRAISISGVMRKCMYGLGKLSFPWPLYGASLSLNTIPLTVVSFGYVMNPMYRKIILIWQTLIQNSLYIGYFVQNYVSCFTFHFFNRFYKQKKYTWLSIWHNLYIILFVLWSRL